MFEAVTRMVEKEKASSRESRSPSSQRQTAELAGFSVTVGKKPTLANSFLDDSVAVLEVLMTLSKFAQRDKTKFYSTADLTGFGGISSDSRTSSKAQSNSASIDSPTSGKVRQELFPFLDLFNLFLLFLASCFVPSRV